MKNDISLCRECVNNNSGARNNSCNVFRVKSKAIVSTKTKTCIAFKRRDAKMDQNETIYDTKDMLKDAIILLSDFVEINSCECEDEFEESCVVCRARVLIDRYRLQEE